MTTWTPKTQQGETWTANTPGLRVFSPLVFSHATHNSLHVFDLGNGAAGVEAWYRVSAQSETWTPA